MTGLLKLCERCFGTADLYQVLGVRRDAASEAEIRRGYHRVSLRVHPDRVPDAEKEEATRKFQILGRVYSVLSDQEQRVLYDEQGIVDEEGENLSRDRDWEEYWRLLFKKITVEDIRAFEEQYKDSEEEATDVKQAYVDFKGDMDKILQSVLCAVVLEDEPRIRKIIQQAIESGEVPVYSSFVKESKKKQDQRKKKAQREAEEAEKMKADLGLGESSEDLKALIQSRKKDRKQEMDTFLADLEAKYCKPSKRRSDKKAPTSKRYKK